ncbi:hypothetical protein EMIT079MI2_250002 [Bacillus sp. IT-79MI2]
MTVPLHPFVTVSKGFFNYDSNFQHKETGARCPLSFMLNYIFSCIAYYRSIAKHVIDVLFF